LTDQTHYRFVIADDHPLFRGALREAVSGLFEHIEIAEAGSFDEVSKLLDAGRARLFRPDVSARAISKHAGRGRLRQ
jgi:DNA-binding NarL/FixJ family response regulator